MAATTQTPRIVTFFATVLFPLALDAAILFSNGVFRLQGRS